MMLPFENQNIEFKREYVPDIRKEVNTKDEQTPRLGMSARLFYWVLIMTDRIYDAF